MHTRSITGYYFFLGLVSLSLAMLTIYRGSQNVSYGQTVGELEKQEQALLTQQNHLQQEISQAVSLSTAQQLAQSDGYVLTTKLVQLPTQTQVALR